MHNLLVYNTRVREMRCAQSCTVSGCLLCGKFDRTGETAQSILQTSCLVVEITALTVIPLLHLGCTAHISFPVMVIQLRASRVGTAALRSTAMMQRIPSRLTLSASSLLRSASTYSQPSRNNSFGFKSSDKGFQDGRRSFDKAPRARFGMQDRGNDRGDSNDGAPRQQERYGAERPMYRSSSTQGEAKTFGRDRPSTYGARSYNGANKDGGDGNDRFQRRQSSDSSERASYRSSSSRGDGKTFDRADRSNAYGEWKTFDRTDRPAYERRKVFDQSDKSSYGERAYKGEAKAFNSDKGSYDRSHVPRSHETSKGYTRNDRPYGQFRRGNEEGGEAGKSK